LAKQLMARQVSHHNEKGDKPEGESRCQHMDTAWRGVRTSEDRPGMHGGPGFIAFGSG
jgi:hypothetical protein